MKKLLLMLLGVLIALPASAGEILGDGTASNPYQISSAEDLCNAYKLVNTSSQNTYYFVQTADIDMEGYSDYHALLGYDGNYNASINYDGKNHIIKNFAPDNHSWSEVVGTDYYYCTSLFGAGCGEVRNLGVVDAYCATDHSASILFARTESDRFSLLLIENVFVTGTLIGEGDCAGAFCGKIFSEVVIYNSFANVEVKGERNTAGLIGYVNNFVDIYNVYTAGSVIGDALVFASTQTPEIYAGNVVAFNTGADVACNVAINGEITVATEETKVSLIKEVSSWEGYSPILVNGYPMLDDFMSTEDGILIFKITSEVNQEMSVSAKNRGIAGNIVIPATINLHGRDYKVTSIGNDAFSYCGSITSISIPEGITTIGSQAFRNCTGISSITIPKSVTLIGNSAFGGCSNLTSITISEGVTSIGDFAFDGCSSLTSITIPESVTLIGISAFLDCTKIKEFIVDPNNTHYTSYCKSLYDKSQTTLIDVPSAIESDSYVVPESVTTIGEKAFYKCQGLTSISLPKSLTSIEQSAFVFCTNLAEVISLNPIAPKVQSDAFEGIPSEAILYVPRGCVEAYESTDGWSIFTTIREFGREYEFIIGNLKFTVTDPKNNEVSVSAANQEISGDITIPATVETDGIEYKVTSFCERAFENCNGLKSIAIPEGFTSIASYAFSGCSSLTSVTMPEGINSIEGWAFGDCSNLTSVELPNGLLQIGEGTFSGSGLKSIKIPSTVTIIEKMAFAACGKLTRVYSLSPTPPQAFDNSFFYQVFNAPAVLFVPETSIDNYASAEGWSQFSEIYEIGGKNDNVLNQLKFTITSEELHEASVTVGDKDITGDIVIPSSVILGGEEYVVTSIEENAFNSYSNIISIEIPQTVTSIGNYAFGGCTSLKYVNIPIGVTTLELGILGGCTSLESITIPVSVNNIKSGAFGDCTNLFKVKSLHPTPPKALGGSWPSFTNLPENSVLYVPKGYIEAYASAEGWSVFSEIREIEGPEGDVDEAFDNMTFFVTSGLKREVSVAAMRNDISGDITIPETVVLAGEEFKVTTIADRAFIHCDSLSTITIPNTITTVGSFAFYNCGKLKSITIPESVTSIGSRVFYDCSNLSAVYSLNHEAPEAFPSSFENIPSDAILFVPEGCVEDYSYAPGWIFTRIREIGSNEDNVFYLTYTITSEDTHEVSVAARNREIPGDIIIPSNIRLRGEEYYVTSIGDWAFGSCSSLTSINLPESLTSIGNYGFYGCSKVTSFILPDSVTSIGDCAFGECSSLTSVNLPNGIQSAGEGIFTECTSLTSISIPYGMTSINSYAFLGCIELTTVSISESVTSIADGAFACCTNMHTIILPESIFNIGESAFYDCSNLSEVYSLNTEAPEALPSSFEGLPADAVLYVPKGSVEAYASAEGWSVFSDIREIKDQTYSLAFNVVYGETPIEGATVTFLDQEYTTDENGCVVIADIDVEEGSSAKFTVYKYGYQLFEGEAEFGEESDVTVDVKLVAAEASLTVKIFAGYNPVEDAYMEFEGKEYFSDEAGSIAVTGLNALDYMGKSVKFTVYKDGYEPYEGVADFTEGLDAFVIVDLVAAEATLTVKVMDGENPVVGARVTVLDSEYTTDENGEVKITGIDGPSVIGKTFAVTVEKEGYETFEGDADFTETLDAYVVAELVGIQTAIANIIADIDRGDVKAYDLQGRRAMHPQSGQVYIINGQKMLVKR